MSQGMNICDNRGHWLGVAWNGQGGWNGWGWLGCLGWLGVAEMAWGYCGWNGLSITDNRRRIQRERGVIMMMMRYDAIIDCL